MSSKQERYTAAQLSAVANEVYAATVHIVDWGQLEVGTRQSKRLIQASADLAAMVGKPSRIPEDYPRGR